MSSPSIQTQSTYPVIAAHSHVDWSAIWGGAFIAAAIWTVFESLALAIFRGAATAASSVGWGMAIWTVVLAVIAMFVAGHETGRLSGVVTRYDAMMHGMMMFGLSVVSAIVLVVLGGVVLAADSARIISSHSGYVMSVGAEWTTFITLVLGWLAAMIGGSSGARQDVVESRQPVQMQHHAA
jgi:hypothetical protein